MKTLRIQKQISEREFLFNVSKAIRETNKIIRKFPLAPSIKNVALELSVATESEDLINGQLYLGLEKSSKRTYSDKKKITLSVKDNYRARKNFVWKKMGSTLYLDLIKFILLQVSDIVALKMEDPSISIDKFEINRHLDFVVLLFLPRQQDESLLFLLLPFASC